MEYRFGAGNPARIETAASELVALAPDLIYVMTAVGVKAVRRTTTIPIVFSLVADPDAERFKRPRSLEEDRRVQAGRRTLYNLWMFYTTAAIQNPNSAVQWL